MEEDRGNYQGLQLTKNSIRHGTILAFGIIQCHNFSIFGKGKTSTIQGQKNEMQKCREIGLYTVYIKANLQNFRFLQNEVDSKAFSKKTKVGFAGHVVQVRL